MKELKKKKKEGGEEAAVSTTTPTSVQYVPYENYISRVVVSIAKQLDKISRDIDVIKERITFDYKEKK